MADSMITILATILADGFLLIDILGQIPNLLNQITYMDILKISVTGPDIFHLLSAYFSSTKY